MIGAELKLQFIFRNFKIVEPYAGRGIWCIFMSLTMIDTDAVNIILCLVFLVLGVLYFPVHYMMKEKEEKKNTNNNNEIRS